MDLDTDLVRPRRRDRSVDKMQHVRPFAVTVKAQRARIRCLGIWHRLLQVGPIKRAAETGCAAQPQ